MPFLKAALIKKQLKPEIIDEPVEVLEEDINFSELHRVIDEKIKKDEIEILEPQQELEVEELEEPERTETEISEIIQEEAVEEEETEEAEPVEIEETQEIETESEITEEPVEELEEVQEDEEELEEPKEPEEFKLMYDVTSGERYVDKVSTKTEFDKMLDELGEISKDLLSWEVEKFAKKYTGKFQGDFEKAESDAKKYEAFLGGYITNAAMILYDNGYKEAAIKKLEQSKSVLEARKKLEDETQAIKERVEEEDATVDLSDILGLFGDG